MILGVGIDIIEVERVEASFQKFGRRFLNRIFCADEAAYCLTHRRPGPHLAARFAAKEAVSKAFGVGIGRLLGWRDIEVLRHPSGAPYIRLREAGMMLFQERRAIALHISLSHTQAYAAAVATLVGRQGAEITASS